MSDESDGERRSGQCERDLGTWAHRFREHELVRVMGVPAARTEPVERELECERGGWRRWPRRGRRREASARAAARRGPGGVRRRVSRLSIPGQRRTSAASSATPSISAGTASSTDSKCSSRSARRSQTSSPAAGTTLKASPEASTVGTAVRCSSPDGSLSTATRLATSASASSAFRPFSGELPECAATPVATTFSVAAALRLATTDSTRSGPSWPASKQRQAS